MKKFFSIFVCFCLVFSLFGCTNTASNQTETTQQESVTQSVEETTTESVPVNNTFKIGSIGPVTGGAAVYGQAVKNAIQIAIDEVNANGGMNGYQVEYRFDDDEHDVEKSINAYNALKDWGMQILIGTVTSSPCIAVAAKTNADNMFQITPSGSAEECVENSNVFRVCFSDPNQGAASADYIDSHNLAKKVGILYDSSDVYSNGIYEKFKEEAEGKNFEIVAEEPFTSDSKTDFTTQLNKMKSAGADLVFLPFYYTEAALVLNQANAMDYKPVFFGCDGMDGILTLENFDKSLAEGVKLLTPFSADATDELTTNFVNKYKQQFGDIPNQFAADAYDAVYIIKAAIENSNINPSMSISDICDNMVTSMTEIQVNGLTGENMVWDENGEPNKEPKAVVIQNGNYVLED